MLQTSVLYLFIKELKGLGVKSPLHDQQVTHFAHRIDRKMGCICELNICARDKYKEEINEEKRYWMGICCIASDFAF